MSIEEIIGDIASVGPDRYTKAQWAKLRGALAALRESCDVIEEIADKYEPSSPEVSRDVH